MQPNPFATTSAAQHRSSSAVGDVFVAVRDGILSGAFAPGQTITESEIATQLGVSRTPVREALRELEIQGLLTRHHRRILVASLSAAEAEDVHEIRVALETLAVRQVIARQPVDTIVPQLERTISEMRYEIKSGDTAMALSSARAFHQAIFEATHNKMLTRFLDQVYNRVDQYRFYNSSQRSSARLRRTIEEHVAIVSAIRDGDVERAEKQMQAHLCASHDFDATTHGNDAGKSG
ncbi:GntR family transcriptional regulator [Mycolicibacterium vinylchloridicum]|uniref:GntR family transcriptional regulator n=1 Tax=Mycolicibacterium vinylchloridicum TaxID=2736928 RepID=UPI0015CB5160|nr:GntR family transcriptional regulator [Mycolicibacterium vinylchloridicum]